MGALTPTHLVIILVIVLLLFGGAKIPQLMRGLGQGVSEFKKGQDESKKPPTTPPDGVKTDDVVASSETK